MKSDGFKLFKANFWTVQLTAGLAMSAKMYFEGRTGYGSVWNGMAYAVGAFLMVIPLSAIVAWIGTVFQLRQARHSAEPPDRPEC